jgi:hypothetical protein
VDDGKPRLGLPKRPILPLELAPQDDISRAAHAGHSHGDVRP